MDIQSNVIGLQDLDFYALGPDPNPPVGWEVTANSSRGDLRVLFPSKPSISRVYGLSSNPISPDPGTVHLSCVTGVGSFTYNFTATKSTDKVYVILEGDSASISFCSVEFASGSASYTFKGTSKIKVKVD